MLARRTAFRLSSFEAEDKALSPARQTARNVNTSDVSVICAWTSAEQTQVGDLYFRELLADECAVRGGDCAS